MTRVNKFQKKLAEQLLLSVKDKKRVLEQLMDMTFFTWEDRLFKVFKTLAGGRVSNTSNSAAAPQAGGAKMNLSSVCSTNQIRSIKAYFPK